MIAVDIFRSLIKTIRNLWDRKCEVEKLALCEENVSKEKQTASATIKDDNLQGVCSLITFYL